MGFLKYVIKREAYNQTRKALRSLGEGDTTRKSAQQRTESRDDPEITLETRSESDEGTIPDLGTKSTLQSFDDYQFEHFVGDLWERMGWQTEVSTQSADRGIDVTAIRRSPYLEKALIQAKRYGPDTTVGSPAIQQYASLKNQEENVDKVIVVTTNEFTQQARSVAKQLNVKLVNGDELVEMVERLDALGLVTKYAPVSHSVERQDLLCRTERAFDGIGGEGTSEPTRLAEADQPIDTSGAEEISMEETSPSSVDAIWPGVPAEDAERAAPSRESSKKAASSQTASSSTQTDHSIRESAMESEVPAETDRNGRWRWVAYAFAAYTIGLIGMAVADPFALMFLAGWVALPLSILLDKRWTSRWRRVGYVIGALFFGVIAGGWYLYRRKQAIGFEKRDGETGSAATETA